MLNNLHKKFATLSKREQLIFAVAVLLVFWFGWDSFFYQPTQKQLIAQQQELRNLQMQISAQQLAALKLENSSHIDQNFINRSKLEQLKAEYEQLQNLMMQDDKSLAPPHLIVVALSDILNQNNDLTLIKLDTLPVTPLFKSKQTPQQQYPIYKHGLSITFSGSYLDTLNYLKALENLPWHFLWESIDYQVKQHPTAETTIRLYTLSFKESWLGV